MPVPQITPPGALQMHAILVGATPALLAGASGAALILAPPGRPGLRRMIAVLGMAGGCLLQLATLWPGGDADAWVAAIAGGRMHLDRLHATVSALCGLAVLGWCWRRGPRLAPQRACLRTAIALLVPLIEDPVVLIACLADASWPSRPAGAVSQGSPVSPPTAAPGDPVRAAGGAAVTAGRRRATRRAWRALLLATGWLALSLACADAAPGAAWLRPAAMLLAAIGAAILPSWRWLAAAVAGLALVDLSMALTTTHSG